MVPLEEHALLLFWVQLFVLVAVARGLGGLMRRVGQPAVVGELAAGLLVGPSVLGKVWPAGFGWLFPADDAVQSAVILSVAWLGVAMLLVVTGFETDLKLLTSLGRSSYFVSTGSLVVPLALGFGLGMVLPASLLGDPQQRIPFALFMAVALSISALPVVAKILMDMNLMRRDIGQITVAAGMANDLVGWILLGTIAGLVGQGGFDLAAVLTTVGLMAVYLVFVLTVGQRLVDAALRRARPSGVVSTFTVVVVAALGSGVLTQLIGVEAVLGAFVAGIVLGRSRYQQAEVRHALETVVHGFLAPVFFATAGLSVDLASLASPTNALSALVVVAVAAVAKLAGSYLGAKLGGMTSREGIAIGIGLNARGAMEIVVATIGLGLGVLNASSYAVVVMLAISTSMMAPPLLRRILRTMEAGPVEAERLEREAVLEASVIAGTEVALVPTRGGLNSFIAARVLDLALQPDTAVAVLTVRADGDDHARASGRDTAAQLRSLLHERRVEHIERESGDVVTAVAEEAALGYGLVALGATEGLMHEGRVSDQLRAILASCPVPMLLVRHAAGFAGDAPSVAFRHLLVPGAGTRVSQAAQEVAFTLAARTGSRDVDVVHVDTRPAEDQVADVRAGRVALLARRRSGAREPSLQPATNAMLEKARALAERFGREVNVIARSGIQAGPELLAVAQERGADTIVVGAQVRHHEGELFLGHGVEHLLTRAPQTVLVVVFPEGA
jgi:Kef-type K+ transport system membrane component KefB/nucleotide-binding universal stress UspA family protein